MGRQRSTIEWPYNYKVPGDSTEAGLNCFVCVLRLVTEASHGSFEQAAQLLEDALKDDLQKYISEILKERIKPGGEMLKGVHEGTLTAPYDAMVSRLNYITCTQFTALLTTNYSTELCMCDPARCSVLQPQVQTPDVALRVLNLMRGGGRKNRPRDPPTRAF